MRFKFKPDFEYIIKYMNGAYMKSERVIVTKNSNDFVEYISISDPIDQDDSILDKKLLDQVIEPVSSVEMFQMWTNYNSLKLKVSEEEIKVLRNQITESLKLRSYVAYGKGKFEPFDYKKMYEIRTDIDKSNFLYEVGKSYRTQSNNLVRVLGRTDLKGYECLICDDGIYRYDRSTGISNGDDGRVTGSCHEYTHPSNFVKLELANRYLLREEFEASNIKTYREFLLKNNVKQISNGEL